MRDLAPRPRRPVPGQRLNVRHTASGKPVRGFNPVGYRPLDSPTFPPPRVLSPFLVGWIALPARTYRRRLHPTGAEYRPTPARTLPPDMHQAMMRSVMG